MTYFPFFMDVSDKKCLIIGGGQAAYQKVKILCCYEMKVHIIAEWVDDAITELKGETAQNIQIEQREYKEQDLEQADFVFVTLEDETKSHQIALYCKQRKIPVNVMDVKEDCSFIMPALLHSKQFDIAISSGGKSPTAVRYLKDIIISQIPNGYDQLIEDLSLCRNYVREQLKDPMDRKQVFDWLLLLGIDNDCKLSEKMVRKVVAQFQKPE